MITLISPAKTLDLDSKYKVGMVSKPHFSKEPVQVVKKMKSLSRKKIANLMSLSEKLADLNYQRFQIWNENPEDEIARQAVLMFKGDVYLGLDAQAFSDAEFELAQRNLRILSGLYGYLKPLDEIQAYRLEMGTKINIGRKKNLYEFWGDKISKAINAELDEHSSKTVVNLASNEYFKAANAKGIKGDIITPIFKDYKNGEYKVISFFAKKARGVMAKWIIKNDIQDPKDLIQFSESGYSYNDLLSKENELVFTRDKV